MLPMSGARQNESSIVNLDNATESDTHWIAYAKRNNRVYFDSFDNLRSPLVRYFENGAMTIQLHCPIRRTIRVSVDRSAVSTNGRRA